MALTLAGTSILCQCEDELITSLENSATFQAMAGAGYADQIYLDELPRRANEMLDAYTDVEYGGLFPCAIIFESDEGGIEFTHTSDGGPFGYSHNIFLEVEFQKERGSASNQDEHREFKDEVQNIVEELLAQSGGDGRFSITRAVNKPIQWLESEADNPNQRLATVVSLEYRTDSV